LEDDVGCGRMDLGDDGVVVEGGAGRVGPSGWLGGDRRWRIQEVKDCCIRRKGDGAWSSGRGGVGARVAGVEGVVRGARVKPPNVHKGRVLDAARCFASWMLW